MFLLLPVAAIAALVLGLTASSASITTDSGFESADGNLAVNSTFDWNGFSPVNYLPSPSATPTRQADKVASGFTFKGLEDWQATTSDNGFAGGVKQDLNCAQVKGTKAPNKDDLKRIYVSHNVGTNGHVYLQLAWVRIPQNTTSASAHVGFEFNQGTTACPVANQADGLVQRTAGDMLIVYDFAGSTTDNPILTVRRWVTSGTCEIGSDSPPCWGPATDLTASGFAEAKVNTTATASDALTPPALTSTTGASTTETLGLNEFGEAGIDLTAANIFDSTTCTSFGQVEGVSRSSGNSGQAAMEDLVGPGHIRISNCGEVKIIKHTDPRGLNQNFSFTSNLAGSQLSCTQSTATSFTLNDNGNTNSDSSANTQDCTNVPAGSYTVTEGSDPSGFSLESLSCDPSSGTSKGVQDGTIPKQANITLAADGVVTCTYTNKLLVGEVKIIKHTDPRGLNQNFSFTSDLAGSLINCTTDTTPASFTLNDNGNTNSDNAANTEDCTNVPVGSYTVTEGANPANFVLESLSCTATGAGSSGAQDGTIAKQANITLAADGVVTCTYTNKQQLGAIKITKTSIKGTALAGAKFSITSGGTAISGSPFTTNANGVICVDNLSFADYVVTEISAPDGYQINDATAHTVTVGSNATCPNASTGASLSFDDTPLTDIAASAHSEAVGGTQSTVTCVDGDGHNVGNSPQGLSESPAVAATGLPPGTYTCTIVVDP